MNHAILNLVKEKWGLTLEPTFHRHVANDIYFSKIGDLEVVLRITSDTQRSQQEIQSELDWINDLRANSIRVCETVLSNTKKEIETFIEADQTFHVVVFKKISGARVEDENLNEDIVHSWATQLAKMNQLSETYAPPGFRRRRWDEDSTYLKALTALNETSEKIKNESLKVFQWMKNRAPQRNEFGLIHADLHLGNFFYDQGQITVFDFDDSCYHWFMYDLAVPLLTLIRNFEEPEFHQKRDRLVKKFIDSYFSIRPRYSGWKEDLLIFYKYRCLFVHLWLIAIRKERNLSEEIAKNFEQAIQWEGQHAFSNDLKKLLLQQG